MALATLEAAVPNLSESENRCRLKGRSNPLVEAVLTTIIEIPVSEMRKSSTLKPPQP